MSNNQTAEALKKVLADTYGVYLKTQNYHWNVTGPNFHALHTMFEEQYTELAAAVDEIAELIRANGHKAPGSYSAFAKLSSINEAVDDLTATQMVKDLYESHQKLLVVLQNAFDAAQSEGDEVTVGVLTERMTVHQKTAWMLQATSE